MNENLRNRLEHLAKIKLADDGTGIFRISAEGLKAIKEIAEEAADTLEDLENKLNLYRQNKVNLYRQQKISSGIPTTKLIKFETMVFPAYNHNTKEWEYLPAKPGGVVFINPDRVKYVAAAPTGEAVYLHFGGGTENDDSVFLRQSLESVVETLEEEA